ncbi:late secretory pathway protein avl9 [Tulasnella sp. 403]|nr:late secretory pathway protein avl9 [Tulasnella sp. 403]
MDLDSVSISSSSSAKSIPLDGPTPSRPSLSYGVHDLPFRSTKQGYTDMEHVQSPSSMTDAELASIHATDSKAPTTRTSLSSQVPSLSGDFTTSSAKDTSSHPNSNAMSASNASTDAMASTVTPAATSPPVNEKPPLLQRASTTSSMSSLGKKVRPDSLIVKSDNGPLILGIALVDFNHSVGPRVEMAYPDHLHQDEEMLKILPFLALPDGAHQSSEDYSYFHLTLQGSNQATSPTSPPETVFGISCNRQIAACDLLEKDADVSRSTVQKAVVVLASKPLFGLIRDRLGVVTTALFNQRDFRDTHILTDFYSTLEISLKSQLTESGLYMGTNLRELIHKFRHRTLVLLKALMLQRKIMFFGHPVERLCTYQYSLVSLIPNLLLGLEDAASPNLDRREKDTEKPTELRTSDRSSLMRYLGLPLNVFGRDSFFQPYLPLQQVDMLKTQSWLCGTTNSIVTQQRDSMPDVLVNVCILSLTSPLHMLSEPTQIEQNTFEFHDPKVERLVALTPADRSWMDDIVRDVNEGWNDRDPSRPLTMQFKGSDDYLRAKFEDYVCSSLASVKYADYLLKTGSGDLGVVGATGDANCIQNFGEAWIAAFRLTHSYIVWNQVTDPALFDICEPRHPCESRPTAMSDIGLRLAEGLHDLKVAETVAPAREAISNAISVGSSGLFRAFEGVRNEVTARISRQTTSNPPLTPTGVPGGTVSMPSSPAPTRTSYPPQPATPTSLSAPTAPARGLRPLSLAPSASTITTPATETVATAGAAARATISSWGSFIAKKAAEYKRAPGTPPAVADSNAPAKADADVSTATTIKAPALRSPPLGFKGALWSFGDRAEQFPKPSQDSDKPSASQP